MLPGLLNFLSMYLIRIARLGSSSHLCILRTCMAYGPFPASSSVSERLVLYLILRASNWFVTDLLPDYAYRSPFILSASLMLDVNCGNWIYICVSCQPL